MPEETPVAIFWDIDTLPLPSESPTYETVNKITDKAHEDGFVVLFKAYSSVPELVNGGTSARYDLQAAGASFVGCAQDGTKNITISTDMLVYAMDHPAPATLIVISDDNLLIYACSILRMRKYRVVVVSSHAGHLMRRRASAFIHWTELMGAISDDDDPELGSRFVQSIAGDTSDATSPSNPLYVPSSEAANQVSDMKAEARSSLRASSGNSDVSSLSSRTFGSEPIDNTYPNKHHCSKYPACNCTRCHEGEEIILDSVQAVERPSTTEPTTYRTRSLSLPHTSPQDDHPPPTEPLAITSKPEEKASITKGQIAMTSISDIISPPSTESLQASETAVASTLPTEHGVPIKTQGTAVGEAQETETVLDTSKTPSLTVTPVSPESAFLEDASATGADLSPDVHTNLIPFLPQPPVMFQPLVDELRHQGGNLRQPSILADGLMERDPTACKRAGVSSFKDYIDRAVDAGIVTVGTMEYPDRPAAPWISLSLAWRIPQNSDTTTTSSEDGSRPPSSLGANTHLLVAAPVSPEANVRPVPPHPTAIFQALVDELRHQGGNLRLRTVVAEGLLKRDPIAYKRAGVLGFKGYIDMAVDAGIVTVGTTEYPDRLPDPWISLGLAWRLPQESAVAAQSSTFNSRPPSSLKATIAAPQSQSLFQSLIDEMRQHSSHPERSQVVTGLLKRDPSVYTRAGVTSFKQFTAKAVAAGVVTLGNSKTEAGKPMTTIYLTPAWKHSAPVQPKPSPLPNRIMPLPNTAAAPNPSSFRNLVEELRRWPIPRPNRIVVAAAMGNRHPLTCATAGCANFEEYFARAMEAGIVNLGETISPGGLVTRWISLKQDTEPRQSGSLPAGSTLEAQSPPQELPPTTTGKFKSLIEVLQQEGDSSLDYFRATMRLMEHDPRAFKKSGVVGESLGGFKGYVTLAEEAGVVTVSEAGAQGARIKRISLNPAWRLTGASGNNLKPATAHGKGPHSIPEPFSPLVERLREMHDNDITRPYLWTVHTALITKNPLIYSQIGVGDCSEYAKNAELAGIVTLGGEGQLQWIALAKRLL
ncbi:hypothetical protein FIBSPDRAFT_1045125 [Athelia psychrophila]|uniref:NYN domain-containing protein n=1 Tax=Athelia psychrophila TaxID=1759441 RepID=A0A166IQ29_9AGAM|nr:hypothetical protein FIBSPDRAFT_1045125 [Fibularhizoctonia sp. CBS 109695]